MDQLASKYHLTEGVGVHIPFTGAHYVKNGSQDISITISVFFHSPRTIIWSRAMRFNNSFKGLFSRVGIKLKEVRPHLKRNYLKAYLLPLKKFIAK